MPKEIQHSVALPHKCIKELEDFFPEPESPVSTTSLLRGIVKLIFFRLWVLAPRIMIFS